MKSVGNTAVIASDPRVEEPGGKQSTPGPMRRHGLLRFARNDGPQFILR